MFLLSSRMLEKSASGVLASLRGSTYRSVRLASSLAAALLDSLFEHPVWSSPVAQDVWTIECPCVSKRVFPQPARGKQILLGGVTLGVLCVVLSAGCTEVERRHGEQRSNLYLTSDTRQPVPLSPADAKEHRAVMLQHLETIQMIVNGLVEEDYELARRLTESHLGFFMHRQAMAQQQPENFPPAYHDLAMAHHAAAEELARIIPSKDIKQILPRFNNVLKACVACHLEYKVKVQS